MGRKIATPRGDGISRHECELGIAIEKGRVTKSALSDFKAHCPVHVVANQRITDEINRDLGFTSSYPMLSVATLRKELGDVLERTVSPDWWAREFPLAKRESAVRSKKR